MSSSTQRPSPRRPYPPFWEKSIPFILALVGLAVLALILISVAVLLGWLK